MKNLTDLLLEVVSNMKNKEFFRAVNEAGLSEEETKEILDAIYSRGE